MSVVPEKPIQKVQFCEDHIVPFTTNAVAIGTTAAAVTDLQAKTSAARSAYNAQQTAQATARATTLAFQNAVNVMSVAVAGIIKQVRAKAEVSGNPNVYALAQIPAPATRTRVGPPGTPNNFVVTLNGDGSLMLKWKCANPAGGTMYQIYRRTTPTGEFAYVGGSGDRTFVDTTVPAGSTSLTYQIQAVRSTAVGMWATFNVFFGATGAGPVTASVEETTSPRIAA